MNSVIQCLANTEPLAKFFLFECYTAHINERNPLGTRGKLAIAFSAVPELLVELILASVIKDNNCSIVYIINPI